MSELRKDPVIERWVIIATERQKRPNDYLFNMSVPIAEPQSCPFCPGNETETPPEITAYRRDGSRPNTAGWNIRVVPNKFPALQIKGCPNYKSEGVYNKMDGIGTHEVIIETPNHKQTFATMTDKKLEEILWVYRDRVLDLKKDKRFQFILLFKNHGEAAGASLNHPHSQLIALPIVPRDIIEEIQGAERHYHSEGRCIYCDIVQQEITHKARLINENDHFICIAPYAARFPFETWILPKNHAPYFEDSHKHEFEDLARMIRDVLQRQDKVLNHPPYNFFIHSLPFNRTAYYSDEDYYHWHLEIMPRLIHVAGFEQGTGFYINPTLPEEAAASFREVEIK